MNQYAYLFLFGFLSSCKDKPLESVTSHFIVINWIFMVELNWLGKVRIFLEDILPIFKLVKYILYLRIKFKIFI